MYYKQNYKINVVKSNHLPRIMLKPKDKFMSTCFNFIMHLGLTPQISLHVK